jgi:hypothetical protein
VNGCHKEAGVAILISDNIDIKLTSVRSENECQFILMKGKIHQEEISFLDIYAPNIGTLIHIKKKNSNRPKSTDRP